MSKYHLTKAQDDIFKCFVPLTVQNPNISSLLSENTSKES